MFEITFVLEIMAFITGLVFFKKIGPAPYRLAVFLLGITVLNEGLSHYGVYRHSGWNKIIFYQGFFLVEYIIIGIIFISVIRNRKSALLLMLADLFVSCFFLSREGAAVFNVNYITAICTGLLLLSVFYLTELVYANQVIDLKAHSLFIFSVGLIVAQLFLLFYVNAKRVESFRNDPHAIGVFRLLNLMGNLVYYLCICYSFICGLLYPRRVGI
ncbi:MAG: hypothetical protein HYZ15_14185 [Sphingobacteriales bacterium]|nr:hypothetical protein [Sphingobacteriales bacterium]